MDLIRYIDFTNLKPAATKEDIRDLVNTAIMKKTASVCVNGFRTKMCAELLQSEDVMVCTVIGFPLGAMTKEVKIFETKQAVADGADEIDMVMNIGALKDKEYDYVRKEIEEIKKACGDKILKVIIETCLLTDEEIVKACELSVEAGADFVKTSTGFSTAGAKTEHVALMKQAVNGKAKVKAAGGIRDRETAMAMIEAGADRIGASNVL